MKNGSVSSSEFESFEYSSVTLTLKSRRKLLIICVYRKQEILFSTFQNEFTLYMDKVMKAGNMLCVVGDFNLWVDVDGDKEAETMIQLMSSYGLEQNVNEPTHRGGHTLDQIYINPYQIVFHHSVEYEPLGLTTDHFPIIVQIPNLSTANKAQTVFYRKLKEIDMDRFREDLKAVINNMKGEQLSFAEHIAELDRVSLELMDKYAPLVSWNKKSDCPQWLDAEYQKNRALRRKYERAWKKNRTEENMKNYTEQKKRCTELALDKQTKHYSKLVGDAGKCQKTLFKVANELLDRESTTIAHRS